MATSDPLRQETLREREHAGDTEKAVDKGVVWLSCAARDGSRATGGRRRNEDIADRKLASTAVLIDRAGAVGRPTARRLRPTFPSSIPRRSDLQGAIDDKPSTNKNDIRRRTTFLPLSTRRWPANLRCRPAHALRVLVKYK